jgi:hypothetical protein
MRRVLTYGAGFAVGAAVIGGALAYVLAANDGGSGTDPVTRSARVANPTPTTTAAAPAAPAPQRKRKRGPWPRRVGRDYQMFSAAGDRALERVMRHAARMLKAGRSREAVMRQVRVEFARVAKAYDDALDTAVCDTFGNELDRWLVAAGYERTEACDEFQF